MRRSHANASTNARLSPDTLPADKRSELVGTGVSTGNERYASALESHDTNYANFDLDYLGMRRRGATNIVAGIEKGVEILYGPGRRGYAVPVLILMTDGIHNQSGDPKTTAENMKLAHPELLIYTITFGQGAEKTAMIDVATAGGGTHHHANDVNDLVDVFRELATSAGVTLTK